MRNETYFVKGQRPIREAVYETRHGSLLNSAQGTALGNGFGLALQTPSFADDKSLDAFFDLSRAQNVERASDASREIRAITLNLVFADASNIGWQVTGRYPNRREGEGLLPSPGWEGRYDWDGYADPMLHPYDQDPAQGWLGTANQRVIPHGYGMQLSNSWAAPERGERLAELAGQPVPSALSLDSAGDPRLPALLASQPEALWAVRSSSYGEDQADSANAGLSTTYLRVPRDQVAARIGELRDAGVEVPRQVSVVGPQLVVTAAPAQKLAQAGEHRERPHPVAPGQGQQGVEVAPQVEARALARGQGEHKM